MALKIKLIVSDFHLGAGHRNPDGSINLLEDFFHDREFIEFINYFSSGVYETADVELVINGDFFNLLMIDFEEIEADIVTELIALRRMKKIMEGHRAVMNALKYFHSLSGKTITFIMGNHDPGFVFPSVQNLVREYCGKSIKFFLEAYEFDGVYVEHGNQYEAANRFNRQQYFLTEGLPQPILNQPWGALFLIHVANGFKPRKPHFDKVLPFDAFLKWLLIYDFRFGLGVVFRIVKYFLVSRFKRDPRRNAPLLQTVKLIWEAPMFPDLDDAAQKILMTRGDIHTVLFGHNHRPTMRQWGSDKLYVNTGTWNAQTYLSVDRLGMKLQCTFALIEYEGDRPKISLKVWAGQHRLCVETDVA